MRVYPSAIILVCLSALLAPGFASAQAASTRFTVARIQLLNLKRYDPAQIAATLDLKPGDPVDQERLQEIADRLTHLGVFSRVNFRFTAENGKATITFDLEEAPLLPVMFENFPWFTDQELADEVRRAVPLFDGRAPRDGALLADITAALSAKLATRGIKANVEHMLVAQPSGDEMIMQFRQDGPSFTIASVSFGDSTAQNSEKLKDRMSDLIGKNFSRFAIELFENEQVRPIYLSAGQIGVQFGAPVVRLGDESGQQDSSTADVQIPIEPGPVYHVSGVNWSGNAALDGAALSKLAGVMPGDLADGMRLASDWQQVELEYGHRGYLDVKVTPAPQFDDAKATVAYSVNISEGPQYRMGRLVITGLSEEAERIVRNNWRLAPGQIFDKTYADEIFAKLEKPSVAIFGERPVHYEKMGYWLRPNPANHVTDVLIDFQ